VDEVKNFISSRYDSTVQQFEGDEARQSKGLEELFFRFVQL
jgi:hypothetical protein